MRSTEFVGVSDLVLLRWLTLRDLRPNLLVMCGDVASEAITKRLMNFCAPPFHVCALPGTLRLPTAARGTLFLTDVAALTLRQQIVLNDWISAERGWVGMDRGGIGEGRGGIGEGRSGISAGRGGIGEGRGGIGAGAGDVQIISMTSAPLWPLVEDGDFLEGLFFRLNVVCLEAQSTEDGRSTSSENRDIAIDCESFSHHFMPRRGLMPRRGTHRNQS